MTQEAINFGVAQASGLEELGGAGALSLNVVMQGGTVRKRPGIAFLPGATDLTGTADRAIIALYATAGGKVYGVRENLPIREIIQVSASGGVSSLSGGPESDLRGLKRPTMAETEALLVFAGGQEPQKVTLAAPASTRLGGSPPMATHVAANASRLLLNDVNSLAQFWYSDVAQGTSYAGHETWNSGDADVKQASARPDSLVALRDNSNEVFTWGTRGLQTWAADASEVYVTVTSTEYGCSAPYSIVPTDESFVWLDQNRRIIFGDGKENASVSDPIQAVLDEMEMVDGTYGFRCLDGWLDTAVWFFPDGRSFAFQKGIGWSQWGSGPTGLSPLKITALTRLGPDTLVGTDRGLVGKLSVHVATDFGEPIVASTVTGFLDRGTTRRKQCRSVRLVLRRGEASGPEPYGFLSWRDDLGTWNPPVKVSMGRGGDHEAVVLLRCLGFPYRRRQWKFTFGGETSLVLAAVSEEFEVLED